ncbi:TetR/AcrR family transcriptional regulator [Nocardiopsis aegyptia]|uniref:AcrR family transcriptional regulator n=1 Tax=Nocardiopsis aegyptia TaxID=220378 RepID=A0A7Z0ERJ9_9ACTN|nr:TetR/AcrR family transcriptional regulator [Nocardiopsis aegyptia]NYJ36986.1 AcrR family transcriptional regulator [Nocardiopsis aegyptia]
MATGRRPGRPRGRRREEILDTALEVFAEGGFHGTSLAGVAERCGLTQQGLLHYFPTKQALLVAVLARRDELDAARFTRDGREETVLSEAAALAEHNQAVPGLVKAYSVLAAESTTEGHPAADHFRRRFAAVRSRFAADLTAEYGGTLPSGVRAEDAAALVAAVMDGLQLQWLHAPDEIDMPALVTAFTRVLEAGQAPPAPAAAPPPPER